MGTNTLTSRSDGQTIPATDHNEIVEALAIDLVPRNNSRAPQDIIGQLGTSAYRWLRSYIKEMYIGTAANNLKIYEGAAGEIWIENPNNDRIKITDGTVELITNNGTRFKVNDSGIDWSVIASSTIPTEKIVDKAISSSSSASGENGGLVTLVSVTKTVKINKNYLVILSAKNIEVDTIGSPQLISDLQIGASSKVYYDFTAYNVIRGWNMSYVHTATASGSLLFDWQLEGKWLNALIQVVEI